MKDHLYILIGIFCLSACSDVDPSINNDISLLPLPQVVNYMEGQFELNARTKIVVPADNREIYRLGELLSEF